MTHLDSKGVSESVSQSASERAMASSKSGMIRSTSVHELNKISTSSSSSSSTGTLGKKMVVSGACFSLMLASFVWCICVSDLGAVCFTALYDTGLRWLLPARISVDACLEQRHGEQFIFSLIIVIVVRGGNLLTVFGQPLRIRGNFTFVGGTSLARCRFVFHFTLLNPCPALT